MYWTQRSLALMVLGIVIFTYFQIFTGLYFVSAIGLAVSAGVFVKFVQDLGKRIEIRDLIAFLALMQWIVGPVLAYNVLPYDSLYYMAVPEEEYMNYVVPACIALLTGMYFPFTDERVIDLEDINKITIFLNDKKYLGYLIAFIGIAAGFAGEYLPKSLSFLFFLLSGLQFVGVYLILFTDSKFKWPAFFLIMGMSISSSVLMGMFGELVLWMMFSLLIISLVLKIPMVGKVAFLAFGMIMILVIQSTKQEYRMATWYAESELSNSQIYKQVLMSKLENPSDLIDVSSMQNMGARLNQGWIIARILNHMPDNYEFVKGETIETALYAGLLPRVLAPKKAVAGGRANFERFTGTELPETTSMDISLVGEGYANYGKLGGIVFLLFIGFFYNWIIIQTIVIAKTYPTVILWLPILFFQVVKAETDFATVFNHFTKAAMVAFMVFWGMTRVLKIKM